ncbi:hypothetical protein BKA69DRAFT_1059733 [Paraphysoderma sedebokerense]|nr:hypothetical protein BKA69DRAFT_1059733 [Paraphysoderma sedebokerense]
MIKIGSLADIVTKSYSGVASSDNKYQGSGTVTFASANTYEGELLDSLMSGNGKYTWTDGTVFKGSFKGNKICGKGQLTWSNGSVYEGNFENNLRTGKGHLRLPTGQVYNGEWKNGKPDGQGILYYNADKTSYYVGNFREGLKHGKGKLIYESGNEYDGEFHEDKRNGYGTMMWKLKNEMYVGYWKDGKPSGSGEYIWNRTSKDASTNPVMNRYKGAFLEGRRHGMGTFYYANGAIYTGEWEDNMKHGSGYYITENGREYFGDWKLDKVVSDFTLYDNDITFLFEFELMTSVSAQQNSPIRSTTSQRTEITMQINMIIKRHITTLRNIYNNYSSLKKFAAEREWYSRGMTREQFWWFLTDSGILKKGISIVTMNRAVAKLFERHKYFNSRYKSPHDPIEQLRFHDYLASLIIISCLLYDPADIKLSICEIGPAACFNAFIKEYIKPLEHVWEQGTIFSHREELFMAVFKVYRQRVCLIYSQHANRQPFSICESSGDLTISCRDLLLMLEERSVINEHLPPARVIELLAEQFPTIMVDNCVNLEYELVVSEFFSILYQCALSQYKSVIETIKHKPKAAGRKTSPSIINQSAEITIQDDRMSKKENDSASSIAIPPTAKEDRSQLGRPHSTGRRLSVVGTTTPVNFDQTQTQNAAALTAKEDRSQHGKVHTSGRRLSTVNTSLNSSSTNSTPVDQPSIALTIPPSSLGSFDNKNDKADLSADGVPSVVASAVEQKAESEIDSEEVIIDTEKTKEDYVHTFFTKLISQAESSKKL